MASAADNQTLSTDAANAILTAIIEQVPNWPAPADLKALAEAYAIVKDAMPRPTSGGRVVMT